MKKIHNKKRNVGIIYEQIVSFICEKTIENNDKDAKKALDILQNHFKKGTQLYKEYKLFNALHKTRNITESLSMSIINECKQACNYHFDEEKLEIEKSSLIKELNYNFGKGVIFENKVKDYTIYATIQVLLNEWRLKTNRDIETIGLFESKLQKWLMTEEEQANIEQINSYDPLVTKIMKEKYEKKYNNILNSEQKNIIDIFMNLENNTEEVLIKKLMVLKENTLSSVKKFKKECNNQILLENIDNVIYKINALDCETINEKNIEKFLYISKLIEEIKGE